MATYKNIATGETIEAPINETYAKQGFVPVAPISVASLQTKTNPVNLTPVETTPPANVGAINSEVTPTDTLSKPESDLQSKINELMNLNTDLAGKTAYQSNLEANNTDLQAQRKTESDLSAQLKLLQNEAANIPNQIQVDAAGRLMTKGGAAPLEASALRINSIKANTVGALLAATQGKIAYAQGLIDKAVNAEYGPKEAQQKALMANLDLIIKSPEYTEAVKKRAQAQLDIQTAKTEQLAQDKANKTAILKTATDAASNGADATTIEAIKNAKTPLDAVKAAGSFLQSKTEKTQIVEAGGRKMLIDTTTGNTIKDLGAVTETGKGTEIVEANGRKLLIDSATGNTIRDLGIAASTLGANTQLKIINGEAFNYNKDTGELTKIVTTPTGFTPEQIQTALDTQTTIDRILNNPNLSAAVGPIASQFPTIRAKTAEVEQDFATLQSLLALGNLNKLKGPMSDKDIQFLKDASSGISLKMSPETLKTRLNALKQRANVVNLKPGELQENTDGTYSYRNLDGTVHTGKLNDNYKDNTFPKIGENNDPLGLGFSKVGSDTNKAVSSENIGNKNVVASSSLLDRLKLADDEFFKATGKHIDVNQSFRTSEQQAELYKKLSAKGARVAKPGSSFHEKGMAIDVTNWKEAQEYLRKYGLMNALPDDRGHFSINEFKNIV